MALDTFVAGRYSGTYTIPSGSPVDVGITKDGYELSFSTKAEMIDESDAFGATLIDFVFRGAEAFLQFTSKAYKPGSLAPYNPWGAFGVIATTAAPIGRLASDVAGSMILTATAGTPAATSPATLTAAKAILAPNFDAKLLFHSKLREVPVRLQLLPSLASGTLSFATQT